MLTPTYFAALDAGIPMTSPSFFADLTLDRARDIFQPDNVNNMHEMPLLEERVRVMNQAGRVLRDKYQGSFVQFLKVAGSSAQTLIKMLIQDFGDIFDDSCEYMGRPGTCTDVLTLPNSTQSSDSTHHETGANPGRRSLGML